MRIRLISKQNITRWVREVTEGTDVFLVDLRVSETNQIRVILDADSGLTIDDCVKVSRYIENLLDRDAEDFELQVLSHGVGNPLQIKRQYTKNVGRTLRVTLQDGSQLEGKLEEAGEEKLILLPMKRGKGRPPKTAEPQTLTYEEIQEAKVIVSF